MTLHWLILVWGCCLFVTTLIFIGLVTWILTPSFIDSALTLVSLEKVDGNVRKSKRAQFYKLGPCLFFP